VYFRQENGSRETPDAQMETTRIHGHLRRNRFTSSCLRTQSLGKGGRAATCIGKPTKSQMRNVQTVTKRKWRLPVLIVIAVDVDLRHHACAQKVWGEVMNCHFHWQPSQNSKKKMPKSCGGDLLKMTCNPSIVSKDLIRMVYASVCVHQS